MKDFTDAGLSEFADVLDAEVVRVTTEGDNWQSVFVKGYKKSRVKEMSLSHAGYIADSEYRRLFIMDTEEEGTQKYESNQI